MPDEAPTRSPGNVKLGEPSTWLSRIAAGTTVLLAAYWGVFAIVTPVTVWDSHTYNLARLLLAEDGGLFAEGIWNDVRQVMFPWTFDAIHYPFLRIGRGYGVAVPSFLCFVGTLIIVWRTVRRHYGTEIAWLACLVLFALPTLIFQATSTKNDIPLVFGSACWFYAWWQWRRTESRGHLLWAALALGFVAGAKSTGVPIAASLGVFTALSLLRTSRQALPAFLAAALAAGLLLGSAETYVNNLRSYDALLGPAGFVDRHRNRDGVRGTAANLLRYAFGTLNVGYDFADPQSPAPAALENASRRALAFLHLRDVGYRPDFDDQKLRFLKSGWEATSDYGPIGTLALMGSFVFLFVVRPRDPAWWLAACGWASLTLISATIAWMPWNVRFLLIPFTCLALSFTLALAARRRVWKVARWGLLVLATFASVAYPLTSYNKKPTDLWRALTARDEVMFAERPGVLEIYRDIIARAELLSSTGLALVAGNDTWVLPFYLQNYIPVVPSPKPTRASLVALATLKGGRLHVLALSRPDIAAQKYGLNPVQRYSEMNSALYILVTEPSQ